MSRSSTSALRDITTDEIGTARKVHEFLGLPFTREGEAGVRGWEADNPKDKHGKADYSAEALGTTDKRSAPSLPPTSRGSRRTWPEEEETTIGSWLQSILRKRSCGSSGSARMPPTIASTCGRSSMSEVKPIRTARDHAAALKEIERLWGSRKGTPEGDAGRRPPRRACDARRRLRDGALPDGSAGSIEAIKFRMEQQGLTRNELARILGTRTRVSEIFNRRRPLSIRMIRRLHDKLGISAEVLIRQRRTKSAA